MNPREFLAILEPRLAVAGVPLSTEFREPLAIYFDVLQRWSRRVNLTGFDLDSPSVAAIDRLFVEPVVAARAVTHPVRALVDIASGGGSPGIPLAVVLRPSRLLLVETRARKCTFLREATTAIGLEGVEIQQSRFEDLAAGYASAFDLLTVRALKLDDAQWDLLANFLENGGQVIHFGTSGGLENPSKQLEGVQVLALGQDNGAGATMFRRRTR